MANTLPTPELEFFFNTIRSKIYLHNRNLLEYNHLPEETIKFSTIMKEKDEISLFILDFLREKIPYTKIKYIIDECIYKPITNELLRYQSINLMVNNCFKEFNLTYPKTNIKYQE